MKQKMYLFAVSLVLTLSACQYTPEENAQYLDGCTSGSMNIVLYVSDDHGQDLSAYGNDVMQTPNLDALADEGV